jgi:hypothetical protein
MLGSGIAGSVGAPITNSNDLRRLGLRAKGGLATRL